MTRLIISKKRLFQKTLANYMQLKKIFSILILALSFFFLFSSQPSLAQDLGIAEVDQVIELTKTDPRTIVGRIINISLSLLGLTVLTLIIYAGALWMMSGGNQDKIQKAQTLLKNAVIGLVIILASWGIATFILERLFKATTGGGGSFVDTSPPGNIYDYGLGAIGSCSVESVYPENNQREVPRNTAIIVTFKETVSLDNVCVNASGQTCSCNNDTCSLVNPNIIRIYKEELDDACFSSTCPEVNTNITDVNVSVSADQKTLVFIPQNYLGEADKFVYYNVKVTSDLKKSNGSSMFSRCSTNQLLWRFEVSNKLDLDPPQVVRNSLFPAPDNERDTTNTESQALPAKAEIFVKDCPQIFESATLVSVEPQAEVSLNYHGKINHFRVNIPADGAGTKALLYNGSTNALLGSADIIDDVINFPNFFQLRAESFAVGSDWDIRIRAEKKADYLSIGGEKYIFADNNDNNNIEVQPDSCDALTLATNMQAQLSGHPNINVSREDNRLNLSAKTAGSRGNTITIESSNNNAFEIQEFSGGSDQQEEYIVRDKKDVAMNAVVRLDFNEPMNPVTLSGSATALAPHLRMVNIASDASSAGASCSSDVDCRSYNCEAGVCVGDYLNGTFTLTNNYRTLEFVSDRECGLNSCGEKMYCLPANSNLALQVRAANLNPCQSNSECLGYTPYTSCSLGELSYRTCQDDKQDNYPLANVANLDGAVDLALNSLDGNRNKLAEGPLAYYSENKADSSERDSYQYSFFVSDRLEASAPRIINITPAGDEIPANNLDIPVKITFDTLMQPSSLQTGDAVLSRGSDTRHKLINLWTLSESPFGFWIKSENVDTNLDGVNDRTVAQVQHSAFFEATSYRAQVGSGVRDVYQNCFKPSAGPGCEANQENPSCCFGSPSSSLDASGNCLAD